MNEIIILPLHFEIDGLSLNVHPVVFRDETGLSLVDCGYPQFLPQLEEAFRAHGLEMGDLKRLILTHHDHDHMGAARALALKYPQVEILCTAEQEPYITGRKKSLRLEQTEKNIALMDEQGRQAVQGFLQMLRSVEPLPAVTTVLNDGGLLPVCGGVRAVVTAGHMPGHLSLYHQADKTLISGDALVCEEGELLIASPEFVLDTEEAVKSVRLLSELELNRVICYHGGEYKSPRLSEELRAIAEKGYGA